MKIRPSILTLMLLSLMSLPLALNAAWAQDEPSPTPEGTAPATTPATQNGQQPDTSPTAAYGQDHPVAPVSENPPISGLDLPSLGPHAAPLSYLQPGIHVTESADSNVENSLGNSSVRSVTRAFGSLDLQRLWSNYDLALDYVGGVGYYDAPGLGFKQLEQLDVDQRVHWKRGQLGIRDAFSYLPEGNFGGAYGSLNAAGEALGGGTFGGENVLVGGTQFGTLGQNSRITNLTLVDAVENLTPKSSITATAGYGFLHYTGNDAGVSGISFLGNTQVSGQFGYDRIVGPHDQVAIVYAYQGFRFSGLDSQQSAFHTNVFQLMWGHRISGRMDFLIAAGPQLTSISELLAANIGEVPPCVLVQGGAFGSFLECPTSDRRLTVSGRASLRYKFSRASVELAYDRYTTAGSGLFPGANSNIVRASGTRPLSRVWSMFADVGYSRNARTTGLSAAVTNQCEGTIPPSCPGSVSNFYYYAFAGGGVHRQLGHDFRAYVSYQFNDLYFDPSYCGPAGSPPCNRTSQRHVATIGLDWTPRPIRLD